MQSQNNNVQPDKADAKDLSYLYGFISQCPNPVISEAMTKLVDGWLTAPGKVPHFSDELKTQLMATNDELLQVGWLLAINPATPPAVLHELSGGSPEGLLERISQDSGTGKSTLAQLSYQAVAEIRIATASNPNTPLASIMLLIKDENPDVRFSIAENPNVPSEALLALTHDDNPYIKMRAGVTLLRTDVEHNVFSK